MIQTQTCELWKLHLFEICWDIISLDKLKWTLLPSTLLYPAFLSFHIGLTYEIDIAIVNAKTILLGNLEFASFSFWQTIKKRDKRPDSITSDVKYSIIQAMFMANSGTPFVCKLMLCWLWMMFFSFLSNAFETFAMTFFCQLKKQLKSFILKSAWLTFLLLLLKMTWQISCVDLFNESRCQVCLGLNPHIFQVYHQTRPSLSRDRATCQTTS